MWVTFSLCFNCAIYIENRIEALGVCKWMSSVSLNLPMCV